jgi:transposase-like protein
MNLQNLAQNFSDEDQARRFLERLRWPDGTICPHCGLEREAYRLTADPDSDKPVRKGVWKCKGCLKQFTVTVGTIFEDSHVPLNKWLMAIHFLCASKKGMSSHQLHRMLGVTYKTAWFMTHRIRYAMTQESIVPLSGTVEIDETYIGGKKRTGPQSVKFGERPKDRKWYGETKAPVVALVQRNGRVHSRHVPKVTADNLKDVINEVVAEHTHVMTDSGTVLQGALMGRKHDQVNHTAGEYVRYKNGVKITTNSVEGFFATLKRGINGVYHHVSKEHLHRYLAEFDFRYNYRRVKDNERSLTAIKRVAGKRLKYRDTKPAEEKF